MPNPIARTTTTPYFHPDVVTATEPFWTNAFQPWIKPGILSISFAPIVPGLLAMTAFTKRTTRLSVKIAISAILHPNAPDALYLSRRITFPAWTLNGMPIALFVQPVTSLLSMAISSNMMDNPIAKRISTPLKDHCVPDAPNPFRAGASRPCFANSILSILSARSA